MAFAQNTSAINTSTLATNTNTSITTPPPNNNNINNHSTVLLPKIQNAPLHLRFTPVPAHAAHIDPPAFTQSTWAVFAQMSDAQKNALLRGILDRCSSKQIDTICSCLNLKAVAHTLPTLPLPPKILQNDLVKNYTTMAYKRKPFVLDTSAPTSSRHHAHRETKSQGTDALTFGNHHQPNSHQKHHAPSVLPYSAAGGNPVDSAMPGTSRVPPEPSATQRTNRHHSPSHNTNNTANLPLALQYAPNTPDAIPLPQTNAPLTQGFSSHTDGSSFVNANIYIKLLNASVDPDVTINQLSNAGPQGAKFLSSFLSSRCKKLQSILQTMHDIATEIDMDKAMNKLLQCIISATDAKYACLYFTASTSGRIIVRDNNWPEGRAPNDTISIDQVFGGSTLIKGGSGCINVYNAKSSEYYTDTIAECYYPLDTECLLAAPVFGDGMKVVGFVEAVNKQAGSPFFNAQDEFMIVSLASLATLLFNHVNVKQSALKKTDDIKSFLNTASTMTTEKSNTGDLLHVIMQTARELVSAERCALFMLDRDTQELWSTVAQGAAEIRFPMNRGIAGHVAMTGETLSIPDAYADARFNRDIDIKTGFKTRNILCLPMFNEHQEIIGVTQVINKVPEQQPFTREDELQLSSFSSLAASTISKQLVFKHMHAHLTEAIQSRTYFAGMLQSIHNVVLSINENGRLASINHPDALGFASLIPTMRLSSFEHWLGTENTQLVDDIQSVIEYGTSLAGHTYTLVIPNQPPQVVDYHISRIAFNSTVDRVMAVENTRRHEPSNKAIPVPTEATSSSSSSAPSRTIRTDAQIPVAHPVTGIMLVFDPITPQTRLEAVLGMQLPPRVLRSIMQTQSQLAGEFMRVSVVVATLYGYMPTASTTTADAARKTIANLASFHEACAKAAQATNGIVYSVDGATVACAFGAPIISTADDAAQHAVTAATMIRSSISSISASTDPVISEPAKDESMSSSTGMRVGIGVSSGNCLCGMAGSPLTPQFTVTGAAVVSAGNLATATQTYTASILVCSDTREHVSSMFHMRELDTLDTSNGSSSISSNIQPTSPQSIFQVIAPSSQDLPHTTMTTMICFELGLSEYRAGNWHAAMIHFKKAVALGGDGVSRVFYERCRNTVEGAGNNGGF